MTPLPFDDTTDFDDADRGLIGSLVPSVVTTDDGRVIWHPPSPSVPIVTP